MLDDLEKMGFVERVLKGRMVATPDFRDAVAKMTAMRGVSPPIEMRGRVVQRLVEEVKRWGGRGNLMI